MKDIQAMLEESVINFDLNDIATIMTSQKRDKEIVKEQREIYNQWLQNR